MKELDTITDAEVLGDLGVALGIRKSAIDAILLEKPSLRSQRKEIVHYWLHRKEIIRQKKAIVPTWNHLADALDEVSWPELSTRIRNQYCQK